MPKLHLCCESKPKSQREADIGSFQQLIEFIATEFNGQPQFIKPIKDEVSFVRYAPEGSQIKFMLKRLSKAAIQAPAEENKVKSILNRLADAKIKERLLFCEENVFRTPHQSQCSYILHSIYLLWGASDVRQRILAYRHNTAQRNHEGDLIYALAELFDGISGNCESLPDPLEFVAHWLLVAEEIEGTEIPLRSVNNFLERVLQMLSSSQQHPEAKTFRMFAFQTQIDVKNSTILNQCLDFPAVPPEQIDLPSRFENFVLECDLSTEKHKSIAEGIKGQWAEKKVRTSHFAFDVEYVREIKQILNKPFYLLVHFDHFQHKQSNLPWIPPVLDEKPKRISNVNLQEYFSLYSFFSKKIRDDMRLGDEKFTTLLKDFSEGVDKEDSEEVKVKVIAKNESPSISIFDSRGFTTSKYVLKGAIFHKGQFYHPFDKNHHHDCLGSFRTVVWSKDKWITFENESIFYLPKNTEKPLACSPDETPVMAMYRSVRVNPGMGQQPSFQGQN